MKFKRGEIKGLSRRNIIHAGLVQAVSTFYVSASFAEEGPKASSGQSFSLMGREYTLANILAPSINGFHSPTSYAEQSRELLQATLSNDYFHLEKIDVSDRWGRQIVNAYPKAQKGNANSPKRSLQYILVSSGAVRVWPQTNDMAFIRALLLAEKKARADKRGLWALKAYSVRNADNAKMALNRFNIIEGRVLNASERRGRAFLNFGDDYRDDFTVTATWRQAKHWAQEGSFDWLALKGEKVRVRGYISWVNGPSISLNHPLQIELKSSD